MCGTKNSFGNKVLSFRKIQRKHFWELGKFGKRSFRRDQRHMCRKNIWISMGYHRMFTSPLQFVFFPWQETVVKGPAIITIIFNFNWPFTCFDNSDIFIPELALERHISARRKPSFDQDKMAKTDWDIKIHILSWTIWWNLGCQQLIKFNSDTLKAYELAPMTGLPRKN